MEPVSTTVEKHYDRLAEEDNDPVFDPPGLKKYMDGWDGEEFISRLGLSPDKSVLEIGVGTGRLAVRVSRQCGSFFGIDLSSKTIQKAAANLSGLNNITLLCGDFLHHEFKEPFDIIYSSLTFMHIEDKQTALDKISSLLVPCGRFVLSIDKNQSDKIVFPDRQLTIFPDRPDIISDCIVRSGLKITDLCETRFACIFTAEK